MTVSDSSRMPKGRRVVHPVLVDDAHRADEDLPGAVALRLRAKGSQRLLVRSVLVRVAEDERGLALLTVPQVQPSDHLHTGPESPRASAFRSWRALTIRCDEASSDPPMLELKQFTPGGATPD